MTGSDRPPRHIPYGRQNISDADIAASAAAVQDRTELEAVVAYLQMLGTAVK